MEAILDALFYIFMFLAMYVQVFFLVTFLERRKEIVTREDDRADSMYPDVTVIVPCWNEEKTIAGTVQSLLALDYPKEKLHLFIVDDGSTDGTWAEIQKFESVPNITTLKKDNGGKHTAMNLGIAQAETDFISCLDADSFVDPSALKRMIPFFDDPSVMAVAPTIVITNPKNLIEWAQKIEYQLSAYVKKMLGFLGGIHVTPGPFSVYRAKVFKDLGSYRKAHNTEDMEIAYRMQENHYRIEQCHDAIVHTKGMPSAYTLYKQRLRWIYGFINNTIDYRRLIFRKRYGTLGLFTIPAGVVSIFAALFLFVNLLVTLVQFIVKKIVQVSTVGIRLPDFSDGFKFDWFFVSTHSVLFIAILMYLLIITSILLGTSISEGKMRLSWRVVPYIVIYSLLAPLWVLRAIFNTVARRETAWR